MIPVGTVLQSLVLAGVLVRVVLLLRGQPLGEALQLGLLLACAIYAAVEAHWAWTVRPRPQRFHQALRRGELVPREHAP